MATLSCGLKLPIFYQWINDICVSYVCVPELSVCYNLGKRIALQVWLFTQYLSACRFPFFFGDIKHQISHKYTTLNSRIVTVPIFHSTAVVLLILIMVMQVTFEVSVEVASCPADKKLRKKTFEIYPVGLDEKLTINLELLCECECEKKTPKVITYFLSVVVFFDLIHVTDKFSFQWYLYIGPVTVGSTAVHVVADDNYMLSKLTIWILARPQSFLLLLFTLFSIKFLNPEQKYVSLFHSMPK